MQAWALLRKNVALQWTRRGSNLSLVLVPCLVLLLVLGIQASAALHRLGRAGREKGGATCQGLLGLAGRLCKTSRRRKDGACGVKAAAHSCGAGCGSD